VKGQELTGLTLAEASRLIRRREISPTELTEACLARIRTLEPQVNAFIPVMAEEAMATARLLGEEAARGELRGPLHGIPVGVKDLFFTAGFPTTAGRPWAL